MASEGKDGLEQRGRGGLPAWNPALLDHESDGASQGDLSETALGNETDTESVGGASVASRRASPTPPPQRASPTPPPARERGSREPMEEAPLITTRIIQTNASGGVCGQLPLLLCPSNLNPKQLRVLLCSCPPVAVSLTRCVRGIAGLSMVLVYVYAYVHARVYPCACTHARSIGRR